MQFWVYGIFFVISFLASVIGAICGIGGGVIIKPALDAFGLLDVAAINFLSGCTVLVMSCYSVVKIQTSPAATKIDTKTGTPLAIGAAIGGIVGKLLFQWVSSFFDNKNTVGAVQAGCLVIITLGTLIYTIKKDKIKTRELNNTIVCVLIGLFLGIMSSFLGIGGGPINLVVLYFFFSMSTKIAAQNSLYIILFSQAASMLMTIVTNTVPRVAWYMVIGMAVCGFLGGVFGRIINRKLKDKVIQKLFIVLMLVIILINIYNVIKYMS